MCAGPYGPLGFACGCAPALGSAPRALCSPCASAMQQKQSACLLWRSNPRQKTVPGVCPQPPRVFLFSRQDTAFEPRPADQSQRPRPRAPIACLHPACYILQWYGCGTRPGHGLGALPMLVIASRQWNSANRQVFRLVGQLVVLGARIVTGSIRETFRAAAKSTLYAGSDC